MKRATIYGLLIWCLFSCAGCATVSQIAKEAAVEAVERVRPELRAIGADAVRQGRELATEAIDKALEKGKDAAVEAAGNAAGSARDRVVDALDAKIRALEDKNDRSPWEDVELKALVAAYAAFEGRKWMRDRKAGTGTQA